MMIKLAPEGNPFIFGFLLLAILVALFAPWGVPIPLILTLFMVYFFRDPERRIPGEDDVFVSPADGKVILISPNPAIPPLLREGEGEGNASGEGGFIEISIFMSPLDVHVNRAPCDGVVEEVVHTPGKFLSAFKHEASLRNENIAMVLRSKHGKVLVRQVAGFLARRAVCKVKPGDSLRKGERYGIIKFSSRLDVYLPRNTRVTVRLGEKVKAGETIVGEI